MTNLDSVLKNRNISFANKGPYSQSYHFSSSCVQIWDLDHKEGWTLKNWCFWIMLLEKTLENPLDSKEIKWVNPKENQPWIFFERTDADAEAEAPVLCLLDAKKWLLWKDPDTVKDWGQEEKRATEGKMVGWHHGLSGHEFEQSLGESGGQRNPACCSPWGHKESDTT